MTFIDSSSRSVTMEECDESSIAEFLMKRGQNEQGLKIDEMNNKQIVLYHNK